MNRFGTLKTKILQKLANAYASGDKSVIKDTIKLIKENKEFVSMYLFYEEFENKYIGNKEDAEKFIDGVIPILKEQKSKIEKFCEDLDKKIGDVTISENAVYLFLDSISENDTFKNVHTKINAKRKLVEHLIDSKKQITENESISIVENEALLHTVLTNNFNVLYSNTLNEEEKKELGEILSISESDLNANFKTLKEEVTEKLNSMLVLESDEVKPKLTEVLTEATSMQPTKYNYYKLQQLKKGL